MCCKRVYAEMFGEETLEATCYVALGCGYPGYQVGVPLNKLLQHVSWVFKTLYYQATWNLKYPR